ncbi:MAG: UbiD family decarboxylase, partial [Gammaproteobacteria bacterium]
MAIREQSATGIQGGAALLPGPYDSLRDYVSALDAAGRLLRIPRMDQDLFEATGFAYRLIEEFGYDEAPAFLVEQLRMDGRWVDGPLLGNIYGGWAGEALAFGIGDVDGSQREIFRRAFDRLNELLDANDGRWPVLPPLEVDAASAPCKAERRFGDAVDLRDFAWIQTNPADAGRYITAASVIVEDPELGRNVGTYRCQIKGPRRLGINAEIGQHAWNFFMRLKQRGETSVPVAVVMGSDPISFALSTSKLAGLGEDEFALAGGLRGEPVELVRCETSELQVPAQAEIVVEGRVPLTEMEAEGPYGEVYGYMGLPKPENFFMEVEAVTHRPRPWVVNSFAGITKLTMGLPQLVANNREYRRRIPNLVEFFRPTETTGVVVASIRKRLPGDGMQAGQQIAASDIFGKVVIVVDEDIDIHDKAQVFHALGTRWQPQPASQLIPQTRGMPLDPSAPRRWLTSKIVIDATRQLPAEGGPAEWPA